MSCRAGLGEINREKLGTTQGKNLSRMFEAQKLQMPQQSQWVPGHAVDICKLPTCCGVMEKVNALLGWIRQGIFHRMGKQQFHHKNQLGHHSQQGLSSDHFCSGRRN